MAISCRVWAMRATACSARNRVCRHQSMSDRSCHPSMSPLATASMSDATIAMPSAWHSGASDAEPPLPRRSITGTPNLSVPTRFTGIVLRSPRPSGPVKPGNGRCHVVSWIGSCRPDSFATIPPTNSLKPDIGGQRIARQTGHNASRRSCSEHDRLSRFHGDLPERHLAPGFFQRRLDEIMSPDGHRTGRYDQVECPAYAGKTGGRLFQRVTDDAQVGHRRPGLPCKMDQHGPIGIEHLARGHWLASLDKLIAG